VFGAAHVWDWSNVDEKIGENPNKQLVLLYFRNARFFPQRSVRAVLHSCRAALQAVCLHCQQIKYCV